MTFASAGMESWTYLDYILLFCPSFALLFVMFMAGLVVPSDIGYGKDYYPAMFGELSSRFFKATVMMSRVMERLSL